jgi:hypothetical protein
MYQLASRTVLNLGDTHRTIVELRTTALCKVESKFETRQVTPVMLSSEFTKFRPIIETGVPPEIEPPTGSICVISGA